MKVAVSIPDALFDSAEALSKRLGVSRSRLYAIALADFVLQDIWGLARANVSRDPLYGAQAVAPAAPRLRAPSSSRVAPLADHPARSGSTKTP